MQCSFHNTLDSEFNFSAFAIEGLRLVSKLGKRHTCLFLYRHTLRGGFSAKNVNTFSQLFKDKYRSRFVSPDGDGKKNSCFRALFHDKAVCQSFVGHRSTLI
jgi:hypothetical protein